MANGIVTEFPVTIYGSLEKYTDTISKGRCRIFYKGGNRNGTYITDEFAEKLLSTIAYAPVKGIYDEDSDDYTDHGESRNQGRIYGIVPENPNLTWESHLDEDGIEREYACVDVYIYTALYSEALSIVGKSQSMELYPKSIKGDWKIIDGKRYYVFDEACFLGLEVLGDDVEPCFEGAAFFALYKDCKKIVEQMEKFNLNSHNGGNGRMINYKLSDGAKFNALWSLLNTNYSEEGQWTVDYDIADVFDSYAVVKNYSEGIWERIYYTKNDENDSVEINSRERCYIMDVSDSEKKALDALHSLNGNNYEKVDENYSAALAKADEAEGTINSLNTEVEGLKEEKTNFESKIEELNNSIATLTTERDEATSQLTEAQTSINSLNEEVATLNSFKTEAEREKKTEIVSKYTELLDADTITEYTNNLDNYSIVDLDKELAYKLVTTQPSVFTKEPHVQVIPKADPVATGVEGILNKYKK